jgi:hypothetical protein
MLASKQIPKGAFAPAKQHGVRRAQLQVHTWQGGSAAQLDAADPCLAAAQPLWC